MNKLILAALLLVGGLSLYAKDKIAIALLEVPPYSSKTQYGYGLSPQILSSILADKYDIEYTFLPLPRLQTSLENGDIFGGIGPSDYFSGDKAKSVITKRLYDFGLLIFYKKAKFPTGLKLNGLDDLKGKKIGVLIGAPEVKAFADAGLTLDPVSDEATNFKKLSVDRLDVVSCPDIMGFVILGKGDYNMADYAYVKLRDPIGIYVMLSTKSADSQKVMADIAAGYEQGLKDNSILAILESYYGKDRVPRWVLSR